MKTKPGLEFWFAVPLAILGACGQQGSKYDDCILEHVTPGMDKAAVAAVMKACRSKFPSGSPRNSPVRELSQEEVGLLGGRAGLSHGNYYSVSLYNGNDDIVVTQIELTIGSQERPYRSDVTVHPKSTKTFGFDIVPGEQGAEYRWSIKKAWGRATK